MNTDDKIRAILQMEADAVEPSAAGYDAIRTGIAARRRRTWWTRGSAFAGAVVATAAALVVFSSDPSPQSIDQPPTTTSPSVSTPSLSPPPTSAAHPDTDPLGAVWPLTTYGELRAWQRDSTIYPSLATANGSATGFMRAYLLVEDGTLVPKGTDDGAYFFEVQRETLTVSTLEVRGFGDGGTAPYLVMSAFNGAVVVRSPEPLTTVTSPLKASGEYNTVDPSILVRLRADDSGTPGYKELGDKHAITGPPNRWDAELAFTTTARTGSIMVTVASLKDGGIAAATVVPIVLTPSTGTPVSPAFAGVRDQRVGVFDAAGTLLRHVTEAGPGGGVSSPDLSPDGTRVAWAAGAGTCSSVAQYTAVSGGGEPTRITTGDGVAGNTTWVGDSRIAYSNTTCSDVTTIRLYDTSTRTTRTLATVAHQPVALAASPDSTWLAWVVDGTLTTFEISSGTKRDIAPSNGCRWRAVDIAGTTTTKQPILVAGETCPGATGFVIDRFAPTAPDRDRVAEVKNDGVTYRLSYDYPSNALLVSHGIEDGEQYVERIGSDGSVVMMRDVGDAAW